MTSSTVKLLAIAAVLTAGIAGTAIAGPPWIAIEYPVNPHNPNTRGAFVTVRTYHHGDLVSYGISGTAEGLVNGRRETMKLDIRRLPEAGTFAVYWKKPAQGTWALVITSSQDNNFMASALIQVDNAGRVEQVSVPSDSIENGRWLRPRKVASAELDAALRRIN
jgi:hypothetical protein